MAELRSQAASATLIDASHVSLIPRLIQRARIVLRSTWVLTGLGVAVGLMLLPTAIVAVTDMAIPMNRLFRFLGLLMIVAPTVWVLAIGVFRPLLRRLSGVVVARRIERELPGIHNRLVSCVDLSENQREHTESPTYSRAFHQRLVREVLERIQGFRVRQILNLSNLQRAGLFAGGMLLLQVALVAIFPQQFPTAVARIFQPFADIPPASGTVYEVLIDDQKQPGDYETLRGEEMEFHVLLHKGHVDGPGGNDPLRLIVQTEDDKGNPKQLRFDFPSLNSDRTAVRLTGMQRSFRFRVYGGRTWTRERTVTLLDRPEIVELRAQLRYPQYMKLPEVRPNPPQVADIAGPRESTVDVQVDVQGDISEGQIELLKMQSRTIAVTARPERVWFSDSLPPGAVAEGKWTWDSTTLVGQSLVGQDNDNKRGDDKSGDAKSGDDKQGNKPTVIKGHTDSAKGKLRTRGFHRASLGFEVNADENLFAYVYVVDKQVPKSFMISWHDGTDWEHRVFWGDDAIKGGTLGTASRVRGGDIPAAGRLIRLEVPAADLGLAGKQIFGIKFMHVDASCIWGPVGAVPSPKRQVNELVVARTVSMQVVPDEESSDRATSSSTQSTAKAEGSRTPRKSTWQGTFRLNEDGFYRVVLRNRLGYENPPMNEGSLTTVEDLPPQVHIAQPGRDLVVSKPVKIPLFLWAGDDFGLNEIVLAVQRRDGGFEGRPIKQFSVPSTSDVAVATVDLSALGAKVGDTLHYRAIARDTRGQLATTKDYAIRIADEPDAVDRQFDEYDKKTDEVLQQAEQLAQQQAEVQQAIENLAEKAAPLEARAEAAEAAKADAAQNRNDGKPAQPDGAKPEPELVLPLTADQKKLLEEIRAELAKLAQQQKQNTEQGKQLAQKLGELAKQSADQPLVPKAVSEQIEAVSEAFPDAATKPLQQLTESLDKNSKDAQTKVPDVDALKQQSQRAAENTQDIQERLKALSQAQKKSRDDVEGALQKLGDDLLQQNAKQTARELSQLRKAIQETRQDLQETGDEQGDLIRDSKLELSKKLAERLAEEQGQLDKKADKNLDKAADLLDQVRQQRDDNQIPGQPPENNDGGDEPGDAKKGDAKKGDAQKGDAKKGDAKKGDAQKGDAKKGDAQKGDAKKGDAQKGDAQKGDAQKGDAQKGDAQKGDAQKGDAQKGDGQKGAGQPMPSQKPLFRPALGGPDPKTDPELARQMRALQRQMQATPPDDAQGQTRQNMQQHQLMQADELDQADQALGSDERVLAELISQLKQAQQGELQPGEASQLSELLQSADVQQALSMAARQQPPATDAQTPDGKPGEAPKDAQAGAAETPSPARLPPASQLKLESTSLGTVTGDAILVELKDLDLATRAIIMKMQPKVREELIQGLREEGPEGYRQFIRDYFRRLTKARSGGQQ